MAGTALKTRAIVTEQVQPIPSSVPGDQRGGNNEARRLCHGRQSLAPVQKRGSEQGSRNSPAGVHASACLPAAFVMTVARGKNAEIGKILLLHPALH